MLTFQVDHYFSAENLKDDKFLLKKLRGHENHAIPFDVIHGFKKMRVYQPESAVIEAVKHCKLVDVYESEGKWFIKRKEAYIIVDPTTGASVTKKKVKLTRCVMLAISINSSTVQSEADRI